MKNGYVPSPPSTTNMETLEIKISCDNTHLFSHKKNNQVSMADTLQTSRLSQAENGISTKRMQWTQKKTSEGSGRSIWQSEKYRFYCNWYVRMFIHYQHISSARIECISIGNWRIDWYKVYTWRVPSATTQKFHPALHRAKNIKNLQSGNWQHACTIYDWYRANKHPQNYISCPENQAPVMLFHILLQISQCKKIRATRFPYCKRMSISYFMKMLESL